VIFGSKSPHRPPTPVAGSASPRCRIQPGQWSSLLRVPIGVRRTSTARKAPGFSPLVPAGWADASGLERVPLIAAGARPLALRGDQPHGGQRMRGPDGSRLLSCPRSRSGIMTGLFDMGGMPAIVTYALRGVHDKRVRLFTLRTAASDGPCEGIPNASIPSRTSCQTGDEPATGSLLAVAYSNPRDAVARARRCGILRAECRLRVGLAPARC